MLNAKTIAVIVPCYKVKDHIVSTIADIPDFVDRIVVVNDGCPAGSGDAIRTISDPRLQVISHAVNQGLGSAMISGFRECLRQGFDIVVKMDGDGQMSGADLAHLIVPLVNGDADYVKGNRWVQISALKTMPAFRRIGNTGLSFMAKAASGYWNIFDPNNGYVAINKTALSLLELDRIGRRYFFENSMLINLNIIRAVVQDVPLPARYGNEASSLSLTRTFFEFPIHMFLGLARRIWWRHFVFDFSLFALYLLSGFPALAFGTVFGSYHWYQSYKLGIVATAGTVMVATLPTLIGFQLILQAVLMDVVSVPSVPLCRTRQQKIKSAT